MPKHFIVYSKYGSIPRNGRNPYPELGGIGKFKKRFKIDDILVKIFVKVHTHGAHGTPYGRKHPSLSRAVKRFDRRMAMFSFQKGRDY